MQTVSLDAMGGDHGPQVVIPAGLQFLRNNPTANIIFVGKEEVIAPLVEQNGSDLNNRWSIVHASEVVAMDELPSQALRSKKDSSMRIAINLVKEGRAQACVSAGNTGALMATARFVLKTLPGVDRPAIVTRLPTLTHKEVRILDLGANVDSSAEHLYQFAVMGSILAQSVDNIANPRVALLNIGQEDIKGNEQVKRTAELLSNNPAVHYIGYVEGDAVFSGNADVVVCDGFVGNVTLKVTEGVAKLISHHAKQAFQKSWFTKSAALIAKPILKSIARELDPRRRNGAILIGLDGIVIKSHGSAGVVAFANAIEEALLEIEKNVPQLIRQRVAEVLQQGNHS